MNSVVIIGRLTKEPDLRYTPSQMAVCKVTIAVDRIGKDKGTDFIPVTVFGKQAENLDRYMTKGRQIAVQGRIQTGSYEKKDGTKVYTTDVIADRVEFLGQEKTEAVKADVPEMGFEQVESDIPF